MPVYEVVSLDIVLQSVKLLGTMLKHCRLHMHERRICFINNLYSKIVFIFVVYTLVAGSS